MSLVNAVILGVVEGLTEFLPVSSTAHLIFASKFLGISQTAFTTFFEVFIQSGAIFAVCILYAKYILNHKSLILNLIISFIPTALVGLLFHKMIKTVFFESPTLIVSAFFVVGIVFLIVEFLIKKDKIQLKKSVKSLTPKEAFIIGVVQSLAIIPGVSRAGAVIVSMIFLGYKREDAALYSFLLAIPTIFAASLFDLLKTNLTIIAGGNNIMLLAIGFITSFVSAIFVIKWFIQFLQRNTLVPFGVYRIVFTLLLWSFL